VNRATNPHPSHRQHGYRTRPRLDAVACLAGRQRQGERLVLPSPNGAMTGSASGPELVDRSFSDDMAIAARLDVTDLVPVLADGMFQGQ
jgi:phosphosulfolactate phosphohydrolase-like enzyme